MIRSLQAAVLVHAVFEYAGIALGAWLYRRALRGAAPHAGPPHAPAQAAGLSDAPESIAKTQANTCRRPQNTGPAVAPHGPAHQPAGPSSLLTPGTFAVVVGLLMGAALGNKAVFLIERPDIARLIWAGLPLWPGQSIVGGLLGGLLGVELAKWLTGQTRSTGDAMVWPIAAGLMLGRVGCFLAGLHDDTYGLPTALPWGIDLGDGVPRHPAPLYEIGFLALLAAALHRARPRLAAVPGLEFKLFLSAYLLWRLGIDGLKPVRVAYPLDLSGIQWVCIVALVLYAPLVARALRRLPAAGVNGPQGERG